jgi:agmatine/peptidylarginine deiminase
VLFLAFLFLPWLSGIPPAHGQVKALGALDYESQEPSVVLMALGDSQNGFFHIDTQREIARAALEATNVVVFIDNYRDLTKLKVKSAFQADPALRKALDQGRLVFSAVPHDTQWIRDYGPQIRNTGKAGFTVIDSRYSDIRLEISFERARKRINLARKQLTKSIIENFDVKKKFEDSQKFRDYLYILQQYDHVLELEISKGLDRKSDDAAPFEMVQKVTDVDEFEIERPELYLDGGNLLRLTDGRLITSKQLFLQNRGNERILPDYVRKHFNAKELVFLEALPGPVIKHVDMFVLPAVGKRILLASYESKSAPLTLSPFDPNAENAEQVQILRQKAHKAMKRNKAHLIKLGYDVIDVPSLPPIVSSNFVYYPTLLNALTLQTRSGGYLIMVPYYPQLDPYLQFAAHKKIRHAFGENAKIVPIDCSLAASQQGAIHCLTATVPYRFSRFARSESVVTVKPLSLP